MIISRTPLRVSFVGGGTDLPAFYRSEAGQVLSCSINKYIYVIIKRQFGVVRQKYIINWSQKETCESVDEIQHPIVRECLNLLGVDEPLEISTFADVPAGTGLGSSSTFTVGLLHALYALKGQQISKSAIAKTACKIEIEILGKSIGKQDQYAAAYGGLNVIKFKPDDTVRVEPVFYSNQTLMELETSLMLFYTNIQRDANKILNKQSQNTDQLRPTLQKMAQLVTPLILSLSGEGNINKFGAILDKAWALKRSLSEDISNSLISEMYTKGMESGALGGKVLGAGGGGFLLMCIPHQKKKIVLQSLADYTVLDLKIDLEGTRIMYYDQTLG